MEVARRVKKLANFGMARTNYIVAADDRIIEFHEIGLILDGSNMLSFE